MSPTSVVFSAVFLFDYSKHAYNNRLTESCFNMHDLASVAKPACYANIRVYDFETNQFLEK